MCSALLLNMSVFDNVPVNCSVLLRSMPGFGDGTWHMAHGTWHKVLFCPRSML